MNLVRTLLTLLQSPTVTPPEPPPASTGGGAVIFPSFAPRPWRSRIAARVVRRVRVVAQSMPIRQHARIALRRAITAAVVRASAALPQHRLALSVRAAPSVRVAASVDVSKQLARARADDANLTGWLMAEASAMSRRAKLRRAIAS